MSSDLADVALIAVRDYLAVRAGERVLVVNDTVTSPVLGPTLHSTALQLGADAVLTTMAPRTRSGEEPPAAVAAAMRNADAVIAVASKSCYHTEAKREAVEHGARGAFNAPSRVEAWTEGAMTADFFQIRDEALRLAGVLRTGSMARVTSPGGTDVTMSIAGREPKGWLTGICTRPGEASAWPGGEVSLPPMEGTAEGIVVVEEVMTDMGALAEPIVWTVREGHVVSIDGGPQADLLRRHIEGVANATNIGELGIGLNPKARITSDITESKKRRGTAHIAMGDSAGGYGGTVISDIHLDGLILEVTVEVDGRVIVERGKVLT